MKLASGFIIFMMLLVLIFPNLLSAEEEKVTVKPYGYIKLDAIYETGNSSHGNFIFYAKDPGNSDGLFHLTAKETRLGLTMQGVSFGKFKVSGKLEVDFMSSGVDENKPYNYMRHAYLEISDGSFSIIAGQTWDIISPLNPVTLNYSVMWGGGNIGYRRPQLSLKKDFKTGKNTFTLQAGIVRTIASDYDNDGIEDGSAAGYPTVEGRIGAKFGLGSNAYIQAGISGHYGKSKGIKDYTSNSLNGDLLIVFSSKFKLIAECFSGKNLGAYLGGIIQNINTGRGKEINSKGFYVDAVVNPSKQIQMSFGYGIDNPKREDLSNGYRSKNMTIFGNFIYNFSSSFRVGLEIADWETQYVGLKTYKTVRFQNSWIFSF